MAHLIKLIRPVNLLVIVLTMYVLHGLFLKYSATGFSIRAVADPFFALLVVSTVLIAAAGNIINDYFDVKIDRINKPEKLIVDRYIKKRSAILIHTVFNLVAVCIALLLLAFKSIYWPLVFHLLTTSVLWLYSAVLKRKFLSGNIAIGILTAMVPMLVYLYAKKTLVFSTASHTDAFQVMAYFALFAFFTTLIREIQKDFADMRGDAMYGCSTVPIYLGVKKGRAVLFAVFAITAIAFVYLYVVLAKANTLNTLFFGVVCLLLTVSFLQSYKAVKRTAWVNAAFTMKLVMVAAIVFFAFKMYV